MLIHYGEVVDDADEMAMIDHEERVYLVLAEHLLYRGELGIGADGLGICRHGLTDSDIDKVSSRTFYGAADKFDAAAAEYRSGLVYGAEKPEEAPLVYALVTKDGVERY